jgi:drug/metabolite transporter (DMT)-like permease
MAGGLTCVNQTEVAQFTAPADRWRYASGALLSLGAVACWTWYPIRNGEWLRAHADRSPRAWATAQGLVTLPLAALGWASRLFWAWSAWGGAPGFEMPLGPLPLRFVGLMLAIGLLASWLGTLLWNEASQRLPPALAGQLIVFETLAALAYAFAWRGQAPPVMTLVGAGLLVVGVVMALRR